MGELSIVVLHCALVGSSILETSSQGREREKGRITSIFAKQFQFLLSRYLILAELIFPLCRDKRCELYTFGQAVGTCVFCDPMHVSCPIIPSPQN